MPIFTIKDILQAAFVAAKAYSDMKGVFAEAMIKTVLLPFTELSITSLFIAGIYIYILWKNKSLIFSGLSHMFNISQWFIGIFCKIFA